MGIFDDAIRQHLDLKRKQGVDDDELKELEDEAFGLPARPGDPEFPEREGAEEGVSTEAGQMDGDDLGADEPEPSTGLMSEQEQEPEADVQEPPAAPEVEEPEVEVEPEVEPDPDPASEASSFTTAEREAIADQPTVFFDQADSGALELDDLDLGLDEDELDDDGAEASEDRSWDDEPATGEEELDDEDPESPHEREPEPPSDELPAASAPADLTPAEGLEPISEEQPAEDAEPVTGEEDVLEETPEFLRENPDDDELWFEQGSPKDFDF
ncbi:hypothetical protein BH24ACT23_BH24ACT23_12850 [soil metagenome]